jgi:hypothetical protein
MKRVDDDTPAKRLHAHEHGHHHHAVTAPALVAR